LVELCISGLSVAETLTRIAELFMQTGADYQHEVVLFFEQYRHLPPKLFESTKGKRDEIEKLVVGVLERGIANGEIRPSCDARLAAFAFIGLFTSSEHWYRPTGKNSATALGSFFASLFLYGVASPDDVERR
jgi:hypothetical protein